MFIGAYASLLSLISTDPINVSISSVGMVDHNGSTEMHVSAIKNPYFLQFVITSTYKSDHKIKIVAINKRSVCFCQYTNAECNSFSFDWPNVYECTEI